MAAPRHDDHLRGDDDAEMDPYRSASRWRHQESSSFARHSLVRDAHTENSNTKGLSDFLNSSRVESDRPAAAGTGNFRPIVVGGQADGAGDGAADGDGKDVVCGPLLNYRRMEGNVWHGSVMIVVKGGGKTQPFTPVLSLRRAQAAGGSQDLVDQGARANGAEMPRAALNGARDHEATNVEGVCLYSDPRNTFWAFPIRCDMAEAETKWAYSVAEVRYKDAAKPATNYFFVPSIHESMRIMFHSCNGFSVGTDEDAWSGPCLWNDVMRQHGKAPFHVMLGGGDQIYNDGIRVNGPLRQWTDIGNPKKRREYPFPEKLRQDCDDYYLNNYIQWYSAEPFALANGQIPQLNIWDDHDIIDGFGSYTNDFMNCAVFRGIGGIAYKYYMLFQHHLAPPASTYTTDSPQTMEEGPGMDLNQARDTYVAPQTLATDEPGYIIGSKPGPYVAQHSMNMFAKLGSRIAFVGLDARTERTRHQVNYPETYDLIFARLRGELGAAAAAGVPFRHLILLLGIPIAYPRLTWLENVFSSPLIAPIKFLNRRFGFGGGVFNHFDGSVDLLDDLDDHYTARTHKKERNMFVEQLQEICAEFSVRLTILGGDVHLAALGRFYSNPNLHIPAIEDHRYMVNVVSSAIVNKPPPTAIANLLAKRNKIHHLNADTDETLMNLFDKDPGTVQRTSNSNHVTMPSRNYAMLTENSPNSRGAAVNGVNGANGHDANGDGNGAADSFADKDGHSFLHEGELNAGTQHKAASPATHGTGNDGSLDCCIRVEIDQHDREGRTEPYGLTIPPLNYEAGKYGTNEHEHHAMHLRHSRSSRSGLSRPGTQPANSNSGGGMLSPPGDAASGRGITTARSAGQ